MRGATRVSFRVARFHDNPDAFGVAPSFKAELPLRNSFIQLKRLAFPSGDDRPILLQWR
jgi:hypothetical protein